MAKFTERRTFQLEKKVKSRDELLKEKESILEAYNSIKRKSHKVQLLTKKEKKVLGIGKDEGKAILNNARISPRKVNIVLALIRNKHIDEAYGILRNTPKAASEVLVKLLKSAEANAIENNKLSRDVLHITEAYANQGPTLKRIMPRAQGRAFKIKKRTSHIKIILREKV
jgi:large subunit ribosomal protein L22